MSGSCVVTGAAGFVGRAVLAVSPPSGTDRWVGWVRRLPQHPLPGVTYVEHGDLADATWRVADFRGVDAVVHAAARVHVMHDAAAEPLAEFRRSNTAATLALAEAAAEAGVRRFVYLSSIKVLGECTGEGERFRADDPPRPRDPYGISKHEAEVGLRQLAGRSRMQVVVIRPPLVYGPGVRANFLRMLRWVHRGVPLPFGAVRNVRSLVGLDNLVDLVRRCVEHPGAANQTFHVSDGEDVSTGELLRRISLALGRPARLLPVPPRLLAAIASLAGMQAEMQRLGESLVVDITKTRDVLSWAPPVPLDEGLRRAAAAFLAERAAMPPGAKTPS